MNNWYRDTANYVPVLPPYEHPQGFPPNYTPDMALLDAMALREAGKNFVNLDMSQGYPPTYLSNMLSENVHAMQNAGMYDPAYPLVNNAAYLPTDNEVARAQGYDLAQRQAQAQMAHETMLYLLMQSALYGTPMPQRVPMAGR